MLLTYLLQKNIELSIQIFVYIIVIFLFLYKINMNCLSMMSQKTRKVLKIKNKVAIARSLYVINDFNCLFNTYDA